jgi:hypothetical protein
LIILGVLLLKQTESFFRTELRHPSQVSHPQVIQNLGSAKLSTAEHAGLYCLWRMLQSYY